MNSRFRPKLNYANVIATIALFVALGGAAVAAGLPKNSVGPNQLKRGAVTTAKIRKAAVTSGKLAPKSVVAGKLGPSSVTPGNIGNGAITTSKLAAGSVIASTIKNGVITTNKLQNEAVNAAKLGKESVTASKLAKGVLTLPAVLPAGQTMRGQFDVGGNTTLARGSVSYPVSLSSLPQPHILEVGQSTPQCPGRTFKNNGQQTPEASPGNLCIYVALSEGKSPTLALASGGDTALGYSVTGSFSEADNANRILAFWAVTAPQ